MENQDIFYVWYENVSSGKCFRKQFTDTWELTMYLQRCGVPEKSIQEMSDKMYELDMKDTNGRLLRVGSITVYKNEDSMTEYTSL